MNQMELQVSNHAVVQSHPILSQSPFINFFKPAMLFSCRYVPRLTGWLGYQLLCRPKRRPFSRNENVALGQAWQWQIKFENKPLQLYSWGEGPIVLFVHGWAANAGIWRNYVGTLVDSGYRVVAFDAPAHGRSGGKVITPIQYMAAIKAVQQDIGEVYAIVSHSVAALATLLACDNKVGTNVKKAFQLPEKLVLLSPFDSIPQMYDYIIDRLNLPTAISKVVKEYSFNSMGKEAIAVSALKTVQQFSHTELMIVHDEKDTIAPFSTSEMIVKVLPYTVFVKTSGLGHNLRHDNVVRAVLTFIGHN